MTTVSPNQPFVPVLYGGDMGTYAMARAFHENYGVTSVIVTGEPNGAISNSRIVDLRPAGTMTDEDRVIQFLLDQGRELAGPSRRPLLLLGSLDLHIGQLVRNREALEEFYTLPYPDERTIAAAANKAEFYAVCEKLGIPHPRTVVIDPGQATEGNAEAAVPGELPEFPLVGKPADSAAWVNARFEGKQKVFRFTDRDAVVTMVGRMAEAGYTQPFILQEMIPGGDENMRLCSMYGAKDGSGTLYVANANVVVEEHSPIVEGNSAGIVTTDNPDIVPSVKALIEHYGWTGWAMVDAKLDPRDGVVKLFEMNPRLGRNHYYMQAAGLAASRVYVQEWLDAGEFGLSDGGPVVSDADSRVDGRTRVLTREHLYTVLPLWLLKKYAKGTSGEQAKALIKARKVTNPLFYKVERSPRRWLYIAMAMVNYVKKFRDFPPA